MPSSNIQLQSLTRQSLARLAPPRSRVLVATSGGPDSQALLDLVATLGPELGLAEIWAAGVDHGLRSEAAEELRLARELAARHAIQFTAVTVRVSRRGNLLAAARRARYRALARLATRLGADRIAVAHTATDQVESVLIHLAHGTGLAGASGMRERRGRIIRPLLGASREAVLAHLAERDIPYARDPSNEDPRRDRARLRTAVLPGLRALNPLLETSFSRFAEQARADDALLEAMARRRLTPRLGPLGSLALQGLPELPQPLASRLLRQWLRRNGLVAGREALLRLLDAVQSGRVALSLGGVELASAAGRLWAMRPASYEAPLVVPGCTRIAELGLRIRTELDDAPNQGGRALPPCSAVAFDADRLHLALGVRPWRHGDRLHPFGLTGHTKVGDLFTNSKVPRPARPAWPVVVHGDDILWVVGLRRAAVAPVTSRTRRVLTLHAEGALPWHRC